MCVEKTWDRFESMKGDTRKGVGMLISKSVWTKHDDSQSEMLINFWAQIKRDHYCFFLLFSMSGLKLNRDCEKSAIFTSWKSLNYVQWTEKLVHFMDSVTQSVKGWKGVSEQPSFFSSPFSIISFSLPLSFSLPNIHSVILPFSHFKQTILYSQKYSHQTHRFVSNENKKQSHTCSTLDLNCGGSRDEGREVQLHARTFISWMTSFLTGNEPFFYSRLFRKESFLCHFWPTATLLPFTFASSLRLFIKHLTLQRQITSGKKRE